MADRSRPLWRLIWCGAAVGIVAAACSSSDPDDPTAFCGALRDAASTEAASQSLDLDDSESLDRAIAELVDLAGLAPREIQDDVRLVAEVYEEVLASIAATAPGARDDVLRDMQPRIDEAAEPAASLERYGQRTCGIRFTAPAQPTPTPTPLDLDD